MARPRFLVRDAQGQFVPPGQTREVLEWSAITGALPSWLTVASGTSTFVAPNSGRHYLQVATGAVSGNSAKLQSAIAIGTGNYDAILFEVESFRLDGSGIAADVVLGINASGSVGAYALQSSSGASVKLFSGGASTDINYEIRTTGEGIQRRNIGIMVCAATKEIVLLENGVVRGYRDGSAAWINGNAVPSVEVITREAAAHSFRVSQVRLTTWAA